MRKRVFIKGNLRSDDYTRAVLTDTSPFEVPIIFSNDGFYKNYNNRASFGLHLSEIIAAITTPKNYTIPYRYNIVKNATSFRQLSLIHPASQIAVCHFYEKHHAIICYYTSQSPFSIRAPEYVGSSFYFASPSSDRNKYKNNSVDTTSIDKVARNPASYFAYKGYNRLHMFFSSQDFVRLEKKFNRMTSLDVAKCFDSIYTHTVSWALKDKDTSKKNTSSRYFGDEFDNLMQKMNYNETNGICIGAEISRIFAETIFNKIDRNIEKSLRANKLLNNIDYEIRRYVDNYYVFTNSDHTFERVGSTIQASLREFKLHINEQKNEIHYRPFYTAKSRATDDLNKIIIDFLKSFIETAYDEGKAFKHPKRIFRYKSLMHSLIRSVKSSCLGNNNAGYELVSNYLIAAFKRALLEIIEDAETAYSLQLVSDEDYVLSTMLLLELSFFFYTMHPTVASSLNLATGIVLSARFFAKTNSDRLPFLQEKVVRWTTQLMRDPRFDAISRSHDAIPIEVLNILIAMHDIAADHTFQESTFRQLFPDIKSLGYFSLVSCLFLIRDDLKFTKLRLDIYDRILNIIKNSKGLDVSAHDIHLALDALACPYFDEKQKRAIIRILRESLGLSFLTNEAAAKIITEMGTTNWFVSWSGVDLLSLITKKQLSTVY